MITRELGPGEFALATALMTTARAGCRVDMFRAAEFWRRWSVASTLLGSIDDAGALYSLRVLVRTPRADTIRLRAQFHRESAEFRYPDDLKRSVRGLVAWLRAGGYTRIVNVVIPPGLPYPDWLLVRLGAVVVGARVEFTTDALEASLVDP
jgi:hypothetical protein